jgi:hypothetical protein
LYFLSLRDALAATWHSPRYQEIASAEVHRLAMTSIAILCIFVRLIAHAALLQSFTSEGKRNG